MIPAAAVDRFAGLLATRERWLVRRCAHHARRQGCPDTGPIPDIGALSAALTAAMRADGTPESTAAETDAAALRALGVTLPAFLGALKRCRQSYRDLVRLGGFADGEHRMLDEALVRAFDALEMDGCAAWLAAENAAAASTFVGRIRHLQALGTMTRGLAHELNNLLQPVIGMAFSVRRRFPTDSTEAHNLALIVDAGKQASEIVNDLLRFAHIRGGGPQPVAPAVEIERAVALLRRRQHPGVTLHATVAPLPVRVVLVPGSLTQAVLNLAMNGIEAMAQNGGTLAITLDGTADGVAVEVRDSGAGMAPEVLAHCREPFFTTKTSDTAAGLGLPVADGIVAAAGGGLDIASAAGAGTAVRIVLPARPDTPAPAGAPP